MVKLIENLDAMVTPVPTNILFIYKHFQKSYLPLQSRGVQFRKHISIDDLTREALNNERSYLILDDVFEDLSDSLIVSIFTHLSHHSNLSVTLILTFLFMKSKIMRLLSSNAHITTLFKSPRDQ